jgi:multidrug efflux pump subunit AcrA (membrane-fusion protein)
MKSQTRLRRLVLTAAAILGAWLAFVDMAPSVLAPFSRVQAGPALATAALRGFPVLASASGMLQLGRGTTLVLRAPFSQAEDAQLTAGQTATVSVDALPGLSLPAKVISIETSATQVGGVPEYYAEVTLSASDPRLRNGQTGTVNVTIAFVNNVLAVPSTALFIGANNQLQVDVWSAGQAYTTTVTIGHVGNSLTEITSGLQAGEQVVLSPAGQSSLPSSLSPS